VRKPNLNQMIDPETEFLTELETFGDEVNEAVSCFSIWVTMHRIARNNRHVYDVFNQYGDFWVACARALHANSLIVLGRIFDKDRRTHSVERLLTLAEKKPSIFSKTALEKRAQRRITGPLLRDFMDRACVPSATDLKRIRSRMNARRKTFQGSYEKLRNKVFAHRDRDGASIFAAKTNIQELARLLDFLNRLYYALWNLFHNGRKLTLGRARGLSQRRVTRVTCQFLKSIGDSRR